MDKIILILLLLVLSSSGISGQKAPVKFGDVSMEEMQMLTYPGDTSASAVILCDYGVFKSTGQQNYGYAPPIHFTRIRRIKILKKEGYVWANSSYPCNSETQIKGITFNLENGKVVKENLKSGSVFEERVTENRWIMRIAMPNVKVGSVIDLQFDALLPMDIWRFQDDIPVKYSELILEDTQAVRFKQTFFGYEPLFITTPNRWVAKDMPSFKEEPLLSSKENYLTKIELDFQDIGFQSIAGSWENVSSILMKNDYFGKALTNPSYLNNIVGTIEDSKCTKEEMIKKAFEAIKSTVKWNEQESVLTSSQTLGFPFKMKIGNSADINLMLLQLLKKLDFDVSPVVMSTREHGFLSPSSPSLQKLNYVIVLAKFDNKSFLLDATEDYMPYYLLPFRCLNYSGRIINENNSEHVPIGTTFKKREFATYHLKMKEDNILEGNMMLRNVDYAALDFRKKYMTFNSPDEYLEDFKKDKQGLQIFESTIYNLDSTYLPVIEDYKVIIDNQGNEIGNEVYILPMFYHQLTENPFIMDFRKYPVDYGYNIEKTTSTVIEIPSDYEILELPGAVKLKLQDDAATLSYFVTRTGNNVNIKSVFSINKIIFMPDEYDRLKEFYNQVIKKHSEPIILKRR